MGNIQVTTQTQAIYPDGFQDSFTIKNNGPFLVYVGENTALDNTDIPLPPSGVIVWDSQRPLYVKAEANAGAKSSSLSLTRNSQPPIFANDFDALLWTKTFGNIVSAMDNWVDCSAYETVTLNIYNPVNLNNVSVFGPNYYDVMVQWFDSAGIYICQDTAQIPWASVNADPGNSLIAGGTLPNITTDRLFGVKARFRVKGAYAYATIANRSGAGQTTWTLTASTRELKPRMMFTQPEGLPYIGAGLTGFTSYVGSDCFTIQNGAIGYNFADVVLPPIGRNWTVAVRNTAAITTAGGLFVRSAFDATFGLDDFPVANIAANDIQAFTFTVPIYQPFKVSVPRIPQQTTAPAGPLQDMRMTFICNDYDT